MTYTFSDGFIMNLQLFAYNPSAQPDNYTGSSDLIPENNKYYYDTNLLDNAGPLLVHEQFAEDEPIPENHGKSVEWRRYAPLAKATTPLTEGVTPDGKKLVVTAITASVDQFGDFIVLTDMLKLTAIDNNVLQATKLLGRQAGLTMDTVVREELHTGGQYGGIARYASSWSGTTETTHSERYTLDANAKLTVLEVQKAVRTLRRNNAPTFDDGYYRSIIHPDCAFDLMRDPEWVDAHQYASPEEIYKGEIGRIAGVRFVQTSEAKIHRGEAFPKGGTSTPAATLTVASAISSASTTISVSETLVASAMVGRLILIPVTGGGYERRKITAATSSSGSTLTIDSSINNVAANAVIYPGEGGAQGIAVYGCLFMGKGAYKKGNIKGGGLETVIQPPVDPLHQKSSVGWKGTKVAKIVQPDYLVRLECGSSNSSEATAN